MELHARRYLSTMVGSIELPPHDMFPVVLSVADFMGIEPIDGGDTTVVRFNAPDGCEIALLVPKPAIADLRLELADLG